MYICLFLDSTTLCTMWSRKNRFSYLFWWYHTIPAPQTFYKQQQGINTLSTTIISKNKTYFIDRLLSRRTNSPRGFYGLTQFCSSAEPMNSLMPELSRGSASARQAADIYCVYFSGGCATIRNMKGRILIIQFFIYMLSRSTCVGVVLPSSSFIHKCEKLTSKLILNCWANP